MTDTRRRELLWDGWIALLAACRAQHPNKPGGAAMCICGAGCGGSAACRMLRELRETITLMPTDGMPEAWQTKVDELRSVLG